MATIDDNLAKAVTEALRQAQIDISNQDKLLVGPGDVTLTRADGTTATGPSWPKMSSVVNAAVQWRGALPSGANLNNYGPTSAYSGSWGQGSSTGATIANGFPEDSAVGVLEVIQGGQFGCTQRYTVRSGNIYIRSLTGSWNGTDGPWGAWLPVGFSSMPGYFTGDMNVLVTPGIWSITSAVTNGPIPDGQTATPTGICTVELRSSTNSVVQTFKSVVTNAAFINRTWTRTLSGTTWSNWDLQGKGALADVGIGSPIAMLPALDWQTFNFVPGAQHVCLPSNQTNIPSGLAYAGTSSPTNINVLGGRAGTTALVMLVTQFTQSASGKSYFIVMSGVAGSRTFAVYENFTSASVIPVANGGTGGNTQATARTGLGLKSAAIYDVYDSNMVFQSERKVAMQAISDYRGITAYAGILNFPQGLSGGVSLGGHLPQSGLGASDLVGQLVCVPWVDASGNNGAFKISARGNKVWFTGTDTNDFFSRAYAFRTEANTAVDGNGFIKTASPIVNVYGDGSVVTNDESEGCTVTRIAVGQYLIEGCLGLNSDAAWGGIDGGFEIPLDRNKQPKVWLDYEVNPDGSVMVKTYHREHAGAPKFARNIIEGVADGDPVDIPAGQFISVRVEMPMDSIWNQQQEKARIRNEEALAQAVLEAKLKAEAEAEAERLKAEEEEPDDPAEQPDVQQ
ncbi:MULTISPECIES: pyocin knob domain-containing protein [unclassified Leclercia]|uniref:pyocin knob domain-containing protein n=1 Tax=unclassified Leclercia TaxID=2627398 RepID=UPI001FEEE18C|nr:MULTISPECIES: pyocin knob domain-containing protein [unclassified Leclercia]